MGKHWEQISGEDETLWEDKKPKDAKKRRRSEEREVEARLEKREAKLDEWQMAVKLYEIHVDHRIQLFEDNKEQIVEAEVEERIQRRRALEAQQLQKKLCTQREEFYQKAVKTIKKEDWQRDHEYETMWDLKEADRVEVQNREKQQMLIERIAEWGMHMWWKGYGGEEVPIQEDQNDEPNPAQDPQPDEEPPSPSPTAQEETTPPPEELTEETEADEKEGTEEAENEWWEGPTWEDMAQSVRWYLGEMLAIPDPPPPRPLKKTTQDVMVEAKIEPAQDPKDAPEAPKTPSPKEEQKPKRRKADKEFFN